MKYELDCSEYKVVVQAIMDSEDPGNGDRVLGTKEIVYPLRENICAWLRTGGIFRSGEDIAEAVTLAKAIRDGKDAVAVLDEREAALLKTCLNKLIELTADGKANLGGEIHENAICRIFGMKEIK